MTNIILNGCSGKMGQTISSVIEKFQDLKIVAGIDKNTESKFGYPVFQDVSEINFDYDVLLDFSRPDALNSLIEFSKKKSKPLILCTTGYNDDHLKIIEESSTEIPIFRSANMSLGVNIVSQILKAISPVLYEDFDIEIIEKHHNQKVDAPSGTALLLADAIRSSIPKETNLVKGRSGISKRKPLDIGIHAIRGGNIVGDHETIFAGSGEIIEITHKAMSREVFALGALKSCRFMKDKAPGLYDMNDMITLNI
ncbi:4-hydroxy-tetrahydrodipicolinate reductase [Clostridium polynesiense]|uniref:4-hydroxy-tetrahydrodipicolinate reductase n=1 Tax=Clostridium polynesiense TaxID=1325933 RepID=UPI000590C00C|nr:4-hydroxy-tetrahydrodipicolinate reductase [Clostridium polynesiense]